MERCHLAEEGRNSEAVEKSQKEILPEYVMYEASRKKKSASDRNVECMYCSYHKIMKEPFKIAEALKIKPGSR